MQTADRRLQTANQGIKCRLGILQTAECRPGIKCRLGIKTNEPCNLDEHLRQFRKHMTITTIKRVHDYKNPYTLYINSADVHDIP